MTSDVHVVVPDTVDDPREPSGGNVYDRRVCSGLSTLGWSVREHQAAGAWPSPDPRARDALATTVAGIPDDAVVVIDGLIASATPDVLVPEARRLRLVVLVHMPLGADPPPAARRDGAAARTQECAVLTSAAAVVTTSEWTRRWLLDTYALRPDSVRAVAPGVDRAEAATPSAAGGRLLCVAAVTRLKGHDVLLTALTEIRDLPWECLCVGSVTKDPDWVDRLGVLARDVGGGDRVRFVGARSGSDLADAYARADLLVLASRAETYGMVVTEALARGVPVIATAVGGQPEALGRASDGTLPGALVPSDDPLALAGALRGWLSEPQLRERFRTAAHERRKTLRSWSGAAEDLALVLAEVAA